ncbi:hypothetical protein F4801DRAFT_601338 [Xylaria longipes]|nr:hypothetical protein F4801DRAFT_601338 [Xylaria longipes]
MAGLCFVLGLLVLLGSLRTCNAAAIQSANTTAMAVINSSKCAITSDLTIFNGTGPRTDIVLFLAWFAGMNELGHRSRSWLNCANYNCIVGLAGSAVSIGQAARGAYAGAKALGWFARSSATWLNQGPEAIELSAFAHAPIFRFKHPCRGLMVLAAREHLTGTRFTIPFANGLEKRARFNEEAAQADPCNPMFDAAGAFDQLEDTIKCFTGGSWPDVNVLKAQLYDSSWEATMGFVHMAFFKNNSTADVLKNLQPSGMPLPECSS